MTRLKTVFAGIARMCALVVSVLALGSGAAFAQDTTYFNQYYDRVADASGARFVECRNCEKDDPNRCVVMTFFVNGNLISVEKFSDYPKNVRHGRSRYWYETGTLCRDVSYENGVQQGPESVYYVNGQLKRKLSWDHDTIVSGVFFKEDGSPQTEVFKEDLQQSEAIHAPEFPGGSDSLLYFLWKNTNYPPLARDNNVQGTVLLQFVVEKNGWITDIQIVKSVHPALDKEALRVVGRMPRWQAGTISGVPVRVRYYMPIKFRLE